MLLLISPAKKLDFDSVAQTDEYTIPDFLSHSQELIDTLKNYSAADVGKLMHLSDNLAQLNYQRYHDWQQPFTPQNAKQAVCIFKGDVYTGMNIESFNDEQLLFTQQHLRILSGLYGLLRPLDLIQPYRLEMGTKLANAKGQNLYDFWGDLITDAINIQLEQSNSQFLINLASNEYFKSVKTKNIKHSIITPIFKELDVKNSTQEIKKYKIVSLFAKRARGMMAAFILKNQLSNVEDIKNFNTAGYEFNEALSSQFDWVFTRDEKPRS